ncbi:MAG: DNA-directed RNA polymerase subunit A' [Candidatus Micrarchaeota archaeon]
MKAVASLRFSLFSPEQIRKMSSVKITVPDTYDEDGYPIAGGLADQRLGVIDPGLKCRTCGGRMKDCPGHFGHIELVRPVIHAGFAKAVYQLLKACCSKCGRLMSAPSASGETAKTGTCPHCGEAQKQVKFVKPTSFYEEEARLLPNEIRERLERIPDEDLRELGIGIRPEWMVLTVLMVSPVTVRPSITLETGERSEDDLTHKLVDILRINQRLEENVDAGAPQLIIEDLWELLQYHVTTYFDNETAGIPPARHRSGRQLKTLFQRLKGKEGRLRYNLSGKRVNFSARTVISPDPTLGINELGVPYELANELTVPVSVTEWNLEGVKTMIRDMPERINYVIRPDGKRKKLTATNTAEVLEELAAGYTIERQLSDGDFVIFNRQPSLHRVSMMCHEVRVLPGKTLRFNVAVCKPYNADFDGDEMNIHVPQNEEAQSEAEMLMKVDGQILSPRNTEPLVAPDLDQITGLYVLTQKDAVFPRPEACGLLNAAGIEEDVKSDETHGRELFSMMLPKDFDFQGKNRQCRKCEKCKGETCDNDAFISIKKGSLKSGHVDSRVSNEIVKAIFTKHGPKDARRYIDAASMMSTCLITNYGLSLSLDDYYMAPEARKQIIELYKDGRKGLRTLVHKYRNKTLERKPGKTLKETLEEDIMDVVERIRHRCWKIVRENIKTSAIRTSTGREFRHNSALLMANAGVKNKPINVVQMCALVGQQAVRGKRMTSGYRNRILPHFKRGDLGDAARGFVRSNYSSGLTPTEYFFHAAGGRDSVVDKGVNPAKTGYMQRRLINALQDLIVRKDFSVRDAEGHVVQYVYGDDAIDPSSGEKVAYGEPVGVIAAQSIGEPGTQMTLRTFHYAGVASLAQLGFTRLVEIVDARKTPKKPVMEIYLKKEFQENWDKAKEIAASIEEIRLNKVASINEDFKRRAVTVVLDRVALKERGISEKDVEEKIRKAEADISVRKDGNELLIELKEGVASKPKKGKKKVDEKESTLRNIRKMTNTLKDLHLKGIRGINRAIIVEKKKADGSIELSLATEGSNLSAVFKMPQVDPTRTTTNDIMEIGEVLGIEAARNAIVEEIKKVLDAQDLKVDLRHIMLIADAMTARGAVTSVGRHGLAGKKASVLARAAFEETAKHLLNACVANEEDTLAGITENIIIGQTIPCGTGEVKLIMETD